MGQEGGRMLGVEADAAAAAAAAAPGGGWGHGTVGLGVSMEARGCCAGQWSKGILLD